MCIYLYIYNIQGVCVSIIYVSSDLFFFSLELKSSLEAENTQQLKVALLW